MLCGILNQTHVTNSHNALGQLFWFSGKSVFGQKVLKRIIQNTPRKGPAFGHMVYIFAHVFVCIHTVTLMIELATRKASRNNMGVEPGNQEEPGC